ncbi:MAG: hypothetical protein JNL98_00655 [Bryobacterales bacterium]|nr:hypothetical protein [Bryobacterales bacterium]
MISVAYVCDAQGRIIRASQGGEGAMFSVEFAYDSAGRIAETTASFAGSPLHRTLNQ